ncbi:MAG: eS6 family ribosomal protein [Candidatus Diapherotrites archaeon]|nr:eS6 family ribosomal protein [Candidatus Diapherotrites archaeon]
MILVISDPKKRIAYPSKIDNIEIFLGKKIGDEVDLTPIGVNGYVVKITGGSDKDGFPMKPDLRGTVRRKILITIDKKKGKKIKITKRGNVVDRDIAQLNLKIVKWGEKPIEEMIVLPEKKEKISIKEQAIKESLEAVEKISSEDAKNIKPKKKK